MANDKINTVEAALVILPVALIEVLEVILTFFPVVGDIIKWIGNIIVWIPIQLWLRWKGARGDLYAAGRRRFQ